MPRLIAKSFALARPSPRPATDTAELTMGLPSTLEAPDADAEVGEGAVEALHHQKKEHREVAEPASWGLPAPT